MASQPELILSIIITSIFTEWKYLWTTDLTLKNELYLYNSSADYFLSRESRMLVILFIVLLYSPWLLFYSIIGSIFNTKILLLILLIVIVSLLHVLVKGVQLIIACLKKNKDNKTKQHGKDVDQLSKTKESWRSKIYEEIVFRCIILNILLNAMDIKLALLMTSILSDGQRLFFCFRVYFFGSPEESNIAKLRLAKRALYIAFTSFAGYVSSIGSGGILFPILIYCYLYYVVYPVVEDVMKKSVDSTQRVTESSYLALIIVFGVLFVLIY